MVIMKISKQILLITPILFIFFSSGCAKNHSEPDYAELDYPELDYPAPDSGDIKEEAEPDPALILEQDVEDIYASSGPKDTGEETVFLSEEGDPDNLEPFLPRNGGVTLVSLPEEEEARRRLPYRSSSNLLDMYFAFDTYDLDEQLMAVLQENVAYLKSHPFSKIEIQGHCDERGSNNYNLALGNQRAQSVKSYLISLGVEEGRIHTVSYGEEKPFCTENIENCWYLNRRVHFLVAE